MQGNVLSQGDGTREVPLLPLQNYENKNVSYSCSF